MFAKYSACCQILFVTNEQHLLALRLRIAVAELFGGIRCVELSHDTPDDGAGVWLQAVDDPDEKIGIV